MNRKSVKVFLLCLPVCGLFEPRVNGTCRRRRRCSILMLLMLRCMRRTPPPHSRRRLKSATAPRPSTYRVLSTPNSLSIPQ
jgi:hypothetical protein